VINDNLPSQKHNGWHRCDLQPQGLRSRAFYYSINSLLHTWITYYTDLPMKVPITPHHLENRYYAPPPIAITGNHLTCIARACSFFSLSLSLSYTRTHTQAHTQTQTQTGARNSQQSYTQSDLMLSFTRVMYLSCVLRLVCTLYAE